MAKWFRAFSQLAGAALMSGAAMAGPDVAFSDCFNGVKLDERKWLTGQIDAAQYGFQEPGRFGGRSIAITVRPGEGLGKCDLPNCQRLELREAKWAPFGVPAWYAFSFRLDGLPSPVDRWVIGQWKEASSGKSSVDASPFLAQRYSYGVFHVTIESNGARVAVASERHTPAQLATFHAQMRTLGPSRARLLGRIVGLIGDVDSLSPPGLPPSEENQRLSSRSNALLEAGFSSTTAEIGRDFRYIDNFEAYAEPTDIVIEPIEATLPNPTAAWADMQYLLRGDRSGGGVVEVWANGQKIAAVRGTIGHRGLGSDQYFKFGHYRTAGPDTVTLAFDEYRRGASQAEVARACAP